MYQNGLIKKFNFKYYDVTASLTKNCDTHIVQYLKKRWAQKLNDNNKIYDTKLRHCKKDGISWLYKNSQDESVIVKT